MNSKILYSEMGAASDDYYIPKMLPLITCMNFLVFSSYHYDFQIVFWIFIRSYSFPVMGLLNLFV